MGHRIRLILLGMLLFSVIYLLRGVIYGEIYEMERIHNEIERIKSEVNVDWDFFDIKYDGNTYRLVVK